MSPHFVLFSGGYATGLMHTLWLDQGAAEPLSYAMRCERDGKATDEFRKVFRAAFSTKDELPAVIATPEGKGTADFLRVFR
jgi:hypothetical protein